MTVMIVSRTQSNISTTNTSKYNTAQYNVTFDYDLSDKYRIQFYTFSTMSAKTDHYSFVKVEFMAEML